MRLRPTSLLVLAFALALTCAGALADERVPDGVRVPAWKELSEQQRTDLAKLSERWDHMPASRRVLILERYQRWQHLPARKREAVREGERNFLRMSIGQREKMRQSMAAVRARPPEEQRRLRQLWRGMSPQQRREWLDRGGPGIAAPP